MLQGAMPRSKPFCIAFCHIRLKEPLPGGFHENRKFIFQVRDKLIERIDDEVRTSMGLVEERRERPKTTLAG